MAEPAGDSDDEPPAKKRKANQHLPSPPDEQMGPYIRFYWALNYTDSQIATQVLDHFNRLEYGLSRFTVKRRREELGLLSTKKRAITWGEIEPIYEELRAKFPNMGARSMVAAFRLEHSIKVSEAFLAKMFKQVEPEAVARRKRKRFKRKRFWAAGVMDILAFDQHDKWKRFGLWLHLGIDPFSGRVAWFKIWWTNRNCKLITSYYINSCREIGGIPLITQSDPGSENYGIANCHTVTRQRLDPSLVGSLQHRWMNKKAMNVKPEPMWSQYRRNFSPGFEDILDEGVNRGLYKPDRPLEKLVFRWLAIPWLQSELDAWVNRYNSTPRRADKNKILPKGIPNMIASKPAQFATKDYKVLVSPELFTEMEETWAPPDDPVFKLVPDAFDEQARALYAGLANPVVNRDTFWIVYSALLNAFETADAEADDHFEFGADPLPDQRELRNGDQVIGNWGYEYLGGLAEPPAQEEEEEEEDPRVYAEFSDDEPEFE
ncbi:hypothetical protein FB451DRAFT_1344417 [Mycena latifolia]|nr:hypothetical protein FB451DRAFT_1344417 [Mycena latifolia]